MPKRDYLHTAAISYLIAHQCEHLSHDRQMLVDRCSGHLRTLNTDISADTADVITLQALGEITARGNNAHLDLTKTTSYSVFVVDPVTRVSMFFTAADLVRIARARAAAANSATQH